MTTQTEALKLALEALDLAIAANTFDLERIHVAIAAIKEALAQPEQELVGYQQLFDAIAAAVKTPYEGAVGISVSEFEKALGSKVYTTPPQLIQQPASIDELHAIGNGIMYGAQPEQEPKKSGCTWCGGDCPQFECDTYSTWMNEPMIRRDMTAHSAAYFMERFKHEEKLLGPNEQAALNFVISILEAQPEQGPVGLIAIDKNKHPYAVLNKCYDKNGDCWIGGELLYTTPPQRKPLTDEQEREAFEQHWYDYYHCGSISPRTNGTYIHPAVQKAWEAWQARAAHGIKGNT